MIIDPIQYTARALKPCVFKFCGAGATTKRFYFLTKEYTRVALGCKCTLPPVWLVPTGVYLIKFLIGNLSYSPCSEPSHTVLFPDVTYTMYAQG